MKARAAIVFALLAVFATTASAVPSTVSFTARLVDDKTGAELTGSHRATFSLFVEEAGGTALWTEEADLEVEEGLVFHDLGTSTPLDGLTLDGKKLFLQVSIDGEVLEPRVALGSVPYAVRSLEATNAQTLGGVAIDELQKRITGQCTAGNFIIGVDTDGNVACAPDLSGSGDITDVIASNGLTGGGTAGSVTLSLVNCGQNEVLKFQGAVWACAPDANSGGDITSVGVGAGGGLAGGGPSGDVSLSIIPCAANQILRFNGAWACSNDIDTNSGGTITGITTNGNSGLIGGQDSGNATLSLVTNCGTGQLLKFNTATTSWGCANDNDSGGDVQDVLGGAGLTATGTTAVTLAVGAGTGIIVGADTVGIDLSFTDFRYDARYVNLGGDTMIGDLNMGTNRVTNRGCPPGYIVVGPGLCVEDIDEPNLTFAQCGNKCRIRGNHLCSAAEFRAVAGSQITVGNGGIVADWVDDHATATTAFVITDSAANVAADTITNLHFCRCCASVE